MPIISKGPDRYQAPDAGLTCIDCDIFIQDRTEAVNQGWQDIEADDGPTWDFLGVCHQCQEKRVREEAKFYQSRGMLF